MIGKREGVLKCRGGSIPKGFWSGAETESHLELLFPQGGLGVGPQFGGVSQALAPPLTPIYP